ncbi:MAG: hypothetical protein RLZZ60_1471 [Bacteroidota bacterium]|jgi:hypothetical protein
MKKLFALSSVIALAAVLLVSCKKDRVCECTYGGQTDKVTLTDATKRQAKDVCITRSYDFSGTTVKVECKLK